MNLDDMIKEWELFEQVLRQPDYDLFKQFLEAVREYKEAVETQEHRPTEALLMALALKNQKLINELRERYRIRQSQ